MLNRRKNNSHKSCSANNKNPELDRRSPQAFISLSSGIGVGCLRTIVFIFLDSVLVSLSWFLAQLIVENVSWLHNVKSFDLITKNQNNQDLFGRYY
jgi:hypothetical protein